MWKWYRIFYVYRKCEILKFNTCHNCIGVWVKQIQESNIANFCVITEKHEELYSMSCNSSSVEHLLPSANEIAER